MCKGGLLVTFYLIIGMDISVPKTCPRQASQRVLMQSRIYMRSGVTDTTSRPALPAVSAALT